ncbi:hypothetical protein EON83_12420 [bacterium]|nr:MAG: hypothetical protein EON83_12420 [bacterium]
MNLPIQVTERDILNGSCNSPYSCAIALAANRALKGHSRIIYCDVLMKTIRFYDGSGDLVCAVKLSKSAKNFVRAYDAGLLVRPFTMQVKLPC